MTFIFSVRTPLPPFHWVLSLSPAVGVNLIQSRNITQSAKKVKMIYQQISPLIKLH